LNLKKFASSSEEEYLDSEDESDGYEIDSNDFDSEDDM